MSVTAAVAVPGAVGSAPAVPGGTQRKRDSITGWMYVSPAVLLFITFILAPFLAAIALCLYSWDLLTPAKFVGLDNIRNLFDDPLVWKTLGNTFIFAAGSIVTHIVGGLLLAIGVNRVTNKVFGYLLRTAIFFPFLISWAAVALLWKYILDPTFGLVAYYLGKIGVVAPDWFNDTHWALPGIIGIDFWHTIGFTFIIMLAGLQTVPKTLLEAARTDGANAWQIFWRITLPLMSPTIFFATVITFLGAFQIFEPMQIITGGGPEDSTTSIVMYLYQVAFQQFSMGYASTIAVLVFLIMMVVTLLQFWGSRRWVYEE